MALVDKVVSSTQTGAQRPSRVVVTYDDNNLHVKEIRIDPSGKKYSIHFKNSTDPVRDIIVNKVKGDEAETLKFVGPSLKVSLEPFINRDGIPRDNFVLEGFGLFVTWQSN